MKAFVSFILFAAVSVILFSCQKELSIDLSGNGNGSPDGDNNSNTSIIGDWNFIATDMDVAVAGQGTDIILGTVKFTNAFKTTTINNKGSLKFTSTDFQSTNLSYSVSTNIQVSTIVSGFPPDIETVPFNFDMPASSSSGKYRQIGNDSLYFPDGTFISIPEASGDIPSSVSGEPGGARFSIVSDTLKIFGGIDTSSVQQIQGLDFSVKQKASVVLKYKRK
jgi:hypothetical protein